MAQTYTDDVYDGAHAGKTDLQNMENNFAALKSSFSGTSSPSNVVGGMLWHDSTGRKVRNYANSAWLISLLGDASQKLWVFRNDTCEGWLIDNTSSPDRVLAIKGGTTYATPGNYGSWAISGITVDNHQHDVGQHTHQIYESTGLSNVFDSNGAAAELTGVQTANYGLKAARDPSATSAGLVAQDLYAKLNTAYNTGWTSPSASGNGTWRPAAAVGTLQYPDLS